MAEKAEETYGTYSTKLTTIKHSAVASWSGYGYQGQCAILHTLKLLLEDRDKVKDYYLSLESYEDFAIMDANKKIVSLHQCKCFSAAIDFTSECKKISDKREYYHKELRICAEDVPCFFHSNITPTTSLTCGVRAYDFQPGQTTCDADKVMKQIENTVADYMKKYSVASSEKDKASILANMIVNKVSDIHQKKSADNSDFWTIATDSGSWIPFVDIRNELENTDRTIHSEIILAIASRNSINTCMTKCLNEDRDDADFAKKEYLVNKFLNGLNSLNLELLVYVIRRIHPHVEWTEDCVDELRAPEKGNYLYKLLTTTTQELTDYKALLWREEGVLESPSTLGNDRPAIKNAEKIRKNPSLAFLCDYRWIVGDFNESVDNIMDKAPSMVDSETAETLERITRPSKLGLLSINDKNKEYVKNHS